MINECSLAHSLNWYYWFTTSQINGLYEALIKWHKRFLSKRLLYWWCMPNIHFVRSHVSRTCASFIFFCWLFLFCSHAKWQHIGKSLPVTHVDFRSLTCDCYLKGAAAIIVPCHFGFLQSETTHTHTRKIAVIHNTVCQNW